MAFEKRETFKSEEIFIFVSPFSLKEREGNSTFHFHTCNVTSLRQAWEGKGALTSGDQELVEAGQAQHNTAEMPCPVPWAGGFDTCSISERPSWKFWDQEEYVWASPAGRRSWIRHHIYLSIRAAHPEYIHSTAACMWYSATKCHQNFLVPHLLTFSQFVPRLDLRSVHQCFCLVQADTHTPLL